MESETAELDQLQNDYSGSWPSARKKLSPPQNIPSLTSTDGNSRFSAAAGRRGSQSSQEALRRRTRREFLNF